MAYKTIQLNQEIYDLLDLKRKELEKTLGLNLSLAQTIKFILSETK